MDEASPNPETLSGGETLHRPGSPLLLDDLDLGQTIRGLVGGQMVFGRFHLKSTLGRGGMGIVWLAWDERLERDVALKFMPDMVRLDSAAVDDLKRETRRSQDLAHPNIVKVFDLAQDEMSAAIAMEFVDGYTLSALRVHQPNRILEPEQIREWISQLCAALDYAHAEAKIVHRDLKPANLMVNSAGRLKITDFGIARSISDSMSRMSAQITDASGTLVYMSPQQAIGAKTSPADDIYSLGATIYELLTGKPPFHSGNIYAQVREVVPPSMQQRREDLEVKEAFPLPPAWETTIAACLSKDPADRPRSAGEVMERLSGSDHGLQISEISESSPPPSQPKSRRVLLVVVAIMVVAGVGLATLFVVSQRQERIVKATSLQAQGHVDMAEGRWQEARSNFLEAKTLNPALNVSSELAELNDIIANPRGTIVIVTDPDGATVHLDGGTSETTPATFSDVPVGKHTVTIEKPGYEPFTQLVTLTEARERLTPETISLRAIPPPEVKPTPVVKALTQEEKIAEARAQVLRIAAAINAYNLEYSHWPKTQDLPKLFEALSGHNVEENPRSVVFLESPASENPGMDPWEQPYQVAIDDDYDGSVVAPNGSKIPTGVLVWSKGDPTANPRDPETLIASTNLPPPEKPAPTMPGRRFFDDSEVFSTSPYAAYNPYSRQVIFKQVQQKLKDAGLYTGSLDGTMGPEMQKAILDFQNVRKLDVTGLLEPSTLNALGLTGIAQMTAPLTAPSATPKTTKSKSTASSEKPAPSSKPKASSSSNSVRQGIENQYRRGQITREEYLNAIKNL